MSNNNNLQRALKLQGIDINNAGIEAIQMVIEKVNEKGGTYSLIDNAEIRAKIDEKYPKKNRQYVYSIIPVTFKDYSEYVDCLNDYGKDGWVFGTLIRTYEDSPEKGCTTHDFICCKIL